MSSPLSNTVLEPCNALVPSAQRIPHVASRNAQHLPVQLADHLRVALDERTGRAFAIMRDKANPYALPIRGRALDTIIRKYAYSVGVTLNKSSLGEVNDYLAAHAEISGYRMPIWNRVAPVEGGIEIDLGDEMHTRVRIANGCVGTLNTGSNTVFLRFPGSKPMTLPSKSGDCDLLKEYVNLDAVSFRLLIAWLTYTIAHPKVDSSKYVILSLIGGQGSGKSFLSRVIKDLIDPSVVGVQVLPTNPKDLAIASQQSHVICYDNLRNLSPMMAGALCITATGGSMSSRQLYSDDEQAVLRLHSALVLNGIHSFIDQPDLAQRCLPLILKPLVSKHRRSEAEMGEMLAAAMPLIQGGLFDLIAQVQLRLPEAKVTIHERMIDFSHWLATMELVADAPQGAYQAVFSDALKRGQREALLDNVLAGAVLSLAESLDDDEWFGTPAKLLTELNNRSEFGSQRSREWPDNAIALSKRLQPLQAGLLTQGVRVEFGRGKERMISISTEENA